MTDIEVPSPDEVDWTALIPEEEWALNRGVLKAAQERGLRFCLGGGLAFSAYSGRWRNTKDMDLFVLPEDREAFVEVLDSVGFVDYFDRVEYVRDWIYRGYREGVIVDIIWQFANKRAPVDEAFLTRGAQVDIRGNRVSLLPIEELIWAKMYIVQRERCDWPDILNLLYAQGHRIDWEHLVRRAEGDVPLLGGVVQMYGWLCPERSRRMLPPDVWSLLGIAEPPPGPDVLRDRRRVDWLDTRDWFGPTPHDTPQKEHD